MANGEDQTIKCVDCGEDFIFTAGEQAFYREKGLTNAPTRCKACREKRKTDRSAGGSGGRGGGREMHAAVCSRCGAETMVPFAPTGARPVYCRDCFNQTKGERPSSPRGGGAPGGREGRPARESRGGHGPRGGSHQRSAPPPATGGVHSQGAVKWFNEGKGFGFIQDDAGEDIFVHFSAIQADGLRTLQEGDRVEYDVVPGAKGKQAANVTRVGG